MKVYSVMAEYYDPYGEGPVVLEICRTLETAEKVALAYVEDDKRTLLDDGIEDPAVTLERNADGTHVSIHVEDCATYDISEHVLEG